MDKRISAPPPADVTTVTPSQLFTYMRKIADWGNQDIVVLLSEYDTNDVINLNTVKSWSSRDFIPSEDYRDAFLNLIRENTDAKYADMWLKAFLMCWANFKSGLSRPKHDTARQASKVLQSHADWIRDLYTKPIMGEAFSIQQLYVPLKLIAYSVERGVELSDQIFDSSILTEFICGELQEKNDVDHIDNHPSWVFVKGGPGSGKSVLALSLARELADVKGVVPIFSRLNRSLGALSFEISDTLNVVSDDYDIGSFIRAFQQSSSETACLIIDGLDEIGTVGAAPLTHVAETLIRDLDKQVKECRLKYQKSLRIIVFGREIITENTVKVLPQYYKLLTMGNLANQGPHDLTKERYGDDLRPAWWKKFLTARGADDGTVDAAKIPDFLSNADHPLYSLGKEPLLAYLIAVSAFPAGQNMPPLPARYLDEKVSRKNRNEIYEDIIGEILDPKRWRGRRHSKPILPYKDFHDVLKYLALATWKNGNSKSATLSGVKRAIGDKSKLRLAFNSFTNVDNEDVRNFHSGNLITAFYYRLAPKIEDQLEDEFEFTHKTFSEYLLATLLFDHFEKLIDFEIKGVSETKKLEAVREWFDLTHTGYESQNIAKFIVAEAELRWKKKPFEHWCRAHSIIDFILRHQSFGRITDNQWLKPYTNIETYSRGIEFIYFFWSTLNAKNWQETHIKYDTKNLEQQGFSIEEIIRFQRPVFIDAAGNVPDKIKNKIASSFTSYSLSGLDMNAENLTGANFQHGHIYGTEISESHLICSVWQGTFLEYCVFKTVSFTQSMFNRIHGLNISFQACDFNRSWFEGAVFDDVNFQACSAKQVYFYDCTFNNCTFESTDFECCHFVKCRFNFAKTFEGEFLTDNDGFLNELQAVNNVHASLKLPVFKNCFYGAPASSI